MDEAKQRVLKQLTQARAVLGWSPRGTEERITAMADSMIAHRVVPAPRAQ